MDNVVLKRQISHVLVPPVNVLEDTEAMNQLIALHVQQKNFLAALKSDDIVHEDVLDYVETYVGTYNMDRYVDNVNDQLEKIIISG